MDRTALSIPGKFRYFMIFLYSVSLLVYGYFLTTGSPYYLTDFLERPRQADYRLLRPAGDVGHGFGIIGSLMMILMLLYSLRKRSGLFKDLGLLSYWLQIHIYLGIMGPLLIVLHSSFKVQGLVAVSFWSMIAVALSGILGRYIYIQIPKTISGKEIDLDELNKLNRQLSLNLKRQYSLSDEQMKSIENLTAADKSPGANPVKIFIKMITSDLYRPLRKWRQKKVLEQGLHLETSTSRQVIKILREKELLERRISLWNSIHQLFHYWHIFHKPFAIIMYIIMLIHILVAIYVGYTWVF